MDADADGPLDDDGVPYVDGDPNGSGAGGLPAVCAGTGAGVAAGAAAGGTGTGDGGIGGGGLGGGSGGAGAVGIGTETVGKETVIGGRPTCPSA